MDKLFFIEVVESSTGKVVKTLGPKPERQADKIEDGLNINLNHSAYHTQLREVAPDAQHTSAA